MTNSPSMWVGIAVSRTKPVQRYAGHGLTMDEALGSAMKSKFWGHPDAEIELVPCYNQRQLDVELQAREFVQENELLQGPVLTKALRRLFKVK